MNHSELIDAAHAAIESDKVEQAVFLCLRLARRLRDHLNIAIFLREMHCFGQQFDDALAESIQNVSAETLRSIKERSQATVLAERTLRFSLGEGKGGSPLNVLTLGVGEFDNDIRNLEARIAELSPPIGMSQFDTAAFAYEMGVQRTGLRLRITAIQSVRAAVKARCVQYVSSVENQLSIQKHPELFLQTVQTEVNNFFRTRSDDVYLKLQKISQLIDSNDQEDHSLLLTEVRRAIKAVADYFLPATVGVVVCSDGVPRELNDEKYMNRLQEAVSRVTAKGSSDDLLKAELQLLSGFARKIHDISCKGVHADVPSHEAKQGVLGLYLFLYNFTVRLVRA